MSRPVEITTGWSFTTIVNTDNNGRFSVTTNCPARGGYYDVTVTFYEDVDLQGSSQTMSLQVLEYIETMLSISSVSTQSGMGLATKFYGYLREKDTGRGIADKAISLTVLGRGGYSFRFELRTDSRGYYEFIYTNNYGSFEWAEARFNGEGLYLASYSGRIYSR
jgi:hypothetical protein